MLTRYQKSVLNNYRVGRKNCSEILSFERASIIFGLDIQELLKVSEFKEYPNWDSVHSFIAANATPTTAKLKYKYNAAVRKSLYMYATELKEVPGYNGDYFRDGRIWGPGAIDRIANIIGKDYEEVKSDYYSQPGYCYRETHYDDTCGIGGGHHTPDGWTDKAFVVVKYIVHLINEEVLYDTSTGAIVEEVPETVTIKIKEWDDVTLTGKVEDLSTVSGYLMGYFHSIIPFPKSRPYETQKIARVLQNNNIQVNVA